MPDNVRYKGLLDMLDGGGAGQSGSTFAGGPLSGLLNALGIRPMGYYAGQEQQAPAMAPMQPQRRPQPRPIVGVQPPAYNPLSPEMAITTTTLPPLGQMSDEDLIRLIQAAMREPPSAMGYGRR